MCIRDRNKVAIVGVGESDIGKVPHMTGLGLNAQAAKRALQDSGLKVSDIDGVLTDGTASLSESGDEDKRYCFQDLDAVTQAKRAGLTVALVTGEDTPSVDRLARRFNCDLVRRGVEGEMVPRGGRDL